MVINLNRFVSIKQFCTYYEFIPGHEYVLNAILDSHGECEFHPTEGIIINMLHACNVNLFQAGTVHHSSTLVV